LAYFKNVVYLVDYTYSVDHSLNKFGYSWFLKNGFQVCVFDLSKLRKRYSEIHNPEFKNTQYLFIDTYESLEFHLSKLDRQNTFFFKIISVDMKIDYKVSSLLYNYNFIVVKQKLGQIPIGANSVFSKFNFDFKYIYFRLRNIIFEKFSESFLENHILLYAGYISNSIKKKYRFCLSSNSSDYNKYLEERNKKKAHENYSVFLDEYVPYHADSDLINQPSPVDESLYYNGLNNFFDQFEKRTNTKIIIAAHPSAKYTTSWNPFRGRKIIYNETPNLIQFSEFVLGHSSTAFTFAILFQKKCLFILDSSCYAKRYINGIRNFANFTGSNLVDLNCFLDLNLDRVVVNIIKYKEFTRKFIREDMVPEKNSFDILIECLDKSNHVK
jgi:hypothetical protein